MLLLLLLVVVVAGVEVVVVEVGADKNKVNQTNSQKIVKIYAHTSNKQKSCKRKLTNIKIITKAVPNIKQTYRKLMNSF